MLDRDAFMDVLQICLVIASGWFEL